MSNTRKRRRPQAASGDGHSLRARLSARQRPSIVYPLLVDDPTEAHATAKQASESLRWAQLRYDQTDHDAALKAVTDAEQGGHAEANARAEVEKWDELAQKLAGARSAAKAAREQVESCYELIRLQAMRPDDYEALIAAHAPAEEQPQPDSPPWNEATFIPALLAACADGDMTAADWAALLAGDAEGHGLSRNESWELRNVVVGLNEKARFADPAALPFGSTTIPSWRWS